jgi:hypothetical protein
MLLGKDKRPLEEELPTRLRAEPDLVPEIESQFLAQIFAEDLTLSIRDAGRTRDAP